VLEVKDIEGNKVVGVFGPLLGLGHASESTLYGIAWRVALQ